MKEFNELGVHSMILTSGTLSPLEILRSELQIPFPVDIENEHVIGPGQISVSPSHLAHLDIDSTVAIAHDHIRSTLVN